MATTPRPSFSICRGSPATGGGADFAAVARAACTPGIPMTVNAVAISHTDQPPLLVLMLHSFIRFDNHTEELLRIRHGLPSHARSFSRHRRVNVIHLQTTDPDGEGVLAGLLGGHFDFEAFAILRELQIAGLTQQTDALDLALRGLAGRQRADDGLLARPGQGNGTEIFALDRRRGSRCAPSLRCT